MPNWVYNHVAISGPRKVLERFIEVAGQDNYLLKSRNEIDGTFSYSNFIIPPKNKLDEYNETNGWKDGKRVGDTEYNWYNWNIRNWGVKWDAGSPELEDEGHQVVLRWESPWSVPEPVLHKMIEKFPKLQFDGRSEEEQGWGCNWYGEGGQSSFTYWDIPGSHADYANPEGYNEEHSCICHTYYEDDPTEWFGDCPGREEAIAEMEKEKENV